MTRERDLTPQEVSNLAGVSANWILEEIRRGHIQARIELAGKGRRYFISAQEVQKIQERFTRSERFTVPAALQHASRAPKGL